MIASKEYWLQQRWGKLQLVDTPILPVEWGAGNRRLEFLCDCGRVSTRSFGSVVNGDSLSCGKCEWKSKDFWLNQKWGTLTLNPHQSLPDEWGTGYRQRFEFLCDCGRTCTRVASGLCTTSTCTRCSCNSRDFWVSQKWGSLQLSLEQTLPEEWAPSSNKTFKFLCSCSRTKSLCFYSVTSGDARSCTQCNYLPKEYWLQQRWGKLTINPNQELPEEWGQCSPVSFQMLCECRRECSVLFYNLTNGSTVGCGSCEWKPKTFWLQQKWGKLKLSPDQELPDEWGRGASNRWEFICECNGNKSTHPWLSVIGGNTNSCGCLAPGKSEFSPAGRILTWLNEFCRAESSFWFKTELGERREYDIYVPSKKLAIEYHGLYWHSEEFKSGVRDWKKHQSARSRGDRLIQIYQDEWRDKQEIIKAQLKDLLAPEKKIRIKPKFEVEFKTSPEVRSFLDAHHYLGAASGCVTIVARHREAIVGAWVFMKRETGVVLWHRACWDRKYKSWNPHEKALSLALPVLKEMGFKKMITFSDNRFHTGNLYEKLRFTFEKEIKPDYSYTNCTIRKSKYALRVPAGVNEVEEAAKKGWYQIWDSGKRRYSLSL